MLYQLVLLAILTSSSTYALASVYATEFVIVITSFNNERYAKDNLKSVCHQKSSKPYHIICINDCSEDKTKDIMEKYVRKHHLESLVTLIHNEKRVGALENLYTAIYKYIPDHKVVVIVDGDDTLSHNEVLLQLEKEYADPDIWLTYGSALRIPDGHTYMSERIPDWVFSERKIREYTFKSQHLRTFKAGLFKKIKKSDLLRDGKFFTQATDMAVMFPMLEMCSPTTKKAKNHSLFIPEILYIYNGANTINLFRIATDTQYQTELYIRGLPPYNPIKSMDLN